MRAPLMLLMLSLAMCSSSALASEEVVCESKGKERSECDMDTRGTVVVVRQLSHAACVEGSTWGLNKHSIWVEGGCRAVFSNTSHDAADSAHHSSAGRAAAAPSGKLPSFNAVCAGMEVHADEGGPVYFDGEEVKLKKVNDNYYEASAGASTVSISRNPDGSVDASFTIRGGANGMCQMN
ncbi:DUF3011 domain-containing protein [Arenimonas sp. MALMAid1274]|uniref:DUF3011 domain-containing protein n=1 Tax=Arenimonas sp. MALMAid1274 TaxID=3411630 RepID=UPI003B9DECAF